MDLYKAIRELHEEKKRLDQVIASLEALLAVEEAKKNQEPEKRRGRKAMSPEERLQVSQRMRAYWAARRQNKGSPDIRTEHSAAS